MTRAAVIVIGSNSTRLVSAGMNEALTDPLRRRVETRLFLHMRGGMLSQEAIDAAAEGIAALIAASDAPVLGIYATSAVRDAVNADALDRRIRSATGFPLIVLSGREEAEASFRGAAGNEDAGVIDIGGGSTEIALGAGGRIERAVSLQLGASRLYRISPIDTADAAERALGAAAVTLKALPDTFGASPGRRFYSVGGTGTAAALLLQERAYAQGAAEGYRLERAALWDLLLRIAAVPREKRAEIPFFPASRADILPTGIAILIAVMDRLGAGAVTVTERCNADGLLRAYVHKKFA